MFGSGGHGPNSWMSCRVLSRALHLQNNGVLHLHLMDRVGENKEDHRSAFDNSQ